MKLANLTVLNGGANTMRGTEAQDRPVTSTTNAIAGIPRTWLWAALAIVGAFIVAALLIRNWFASENMVSRTQLRIATVTSGPFVRDVSAQGTVVAAVSPTVFAPGVGTIIYATRAGDNVKRGQLLASLESPTLQNEYERERASLDGLDAGVLRQKIEVRRAMLRSRQQRDLAQVQIRASEREMARAQSSWDVQVISQRDYERARDDLATAKLNFEQARESIGLDDESLRLELKSRELERSRQALLVQSLKRRVDQLQVRAPIDGIVATLGQAQRANVSENAPLLTVVDLSQLEIEFQVAETYAGEIKPGMKAEVQLDGRKLLAAVAGISPEVRSGQVTGRVRFEGEQPAGLRQNQRGAVRIVLDERPHATKFERGPGISEGQSNVYVVQGSSAQRVPVTFGAMSVAEVEVLSGLKTGDQLITSDMSDYRDIATISLRN
jgi:HlyD family secretion protein